MGEIKKIVLVEDEIDTAKVIVKRLATAGYNVMVSQDALQAFRIINEERPDLVILDLMLPGRGGLSVLERMRLSAFTTHIPVVVLTGMKDETHKKKVLDEGVDAYLEKPYEAQELLTVIKDILTRNAQDNNG